MERRTKQRTCIECRAAADKQQLLRIVRTPEGSIEFDRSGRANGRGAYVCSLACFEKALRSHKFDRALRTKVDDQKCKELVEAVTSSVLNSEAQSFA